MKKNIFFQVRILTLITTITIFISSCSLHLKSSGIASIKLLPAANVTQDQALDYQVNNINKNIKNKKLLLPIIKNNIYNIPGVWNDFFSNKKPKFSDQYIDNYLKNKMNDLQTLNLYKKTLFISQNDQFLGKYQGKRIDPDNITLDGFNFTSNLVIEMKENNYIGFGFKTNNNMSFLDHFIEQYNYCDTSILANSPLSNVSMHNYEYISSLHFTLVWINGHQRILSLPHFSQNNHFDHQEWTINKITKYFKNLWGLKYDDYMKELRKITSQQNSIFNKKGGLFLQYLMPLGYWEMVPISKNIIIMVVHSNLTPFAQTAGQILYNLDLNLTNNTNLTSQILGPLSIINSEDVGNRKAEEKAWINLWNNTTNGPLIGYYSRTLAIVIYKNDEDY